MIRHISMQFACLVLHSNIVTLEQSSKDILSGIFLRTVFSEFLHKHIIASRDDKHGLYDDLLTIIFLPVLRIGVPVFFASSLCN